MADDDKSKTPRQPNIKEEPDPADAFARVKPDIPPADEGLPFDGPPPRKPKKKRAPSDPIIIDKGERKEVIDDEGIDPADAAGEILEMFDGFFSIAAALRGYDQIAVQTPTGVKPAMELITAKQAVARPRTERAIVRYMKSVGANVSPGMGCAFALFGMYAAPIVGMELGLAMARKQAKSQAG